MSKVVDEVRHKIACGQNLFRRSTIEKMLAEYDRLLMRNAALEKNAVEPLLALDGARFCPACHALLEEGSVYCDTCGTDTPRQ